MLNAIAKLYRIHATLVNFVNFEILHTNRFFCSMCDTDKLMKSISPGWLFKSTFIYVTQTLLSHPASVFPERDTPLASPSKWNQRAPDCLFVLQTRIYFSARWEKHMEDGTSNTEWKNLLRSKTHTNKQTLHNTNAQMQNQQIKRYGRTCA